jgi:hypothetical protein
MIEIGFSDPVQWRIATRRHDWLDGALLGTFLRRWTATGLIGRPDRLEAGDEDEHWPVEEGEPLAETILRIPRDEDGGLSCVMRGREPKLWWMSVVLSGFDAERGRTTSYSMINLNLPRRDCEEMDATLLDLFEELHRPDSCDYASIHPEHHAEILRLRAFVPALTITPMFAGFLWANFLGPGIVERFSPETIDRLDVARRRWFDTSGVLIAVSEDLSSIDSRPWECRLIELTELMRPGSV